jgi:hypothetical protein
MKEQARETRREREQEPEAEAEAMGAKEKEDARAREREEKKRFLLEQLRREQASMTEEMEGGREGKAKDG